MKPEPPEMNGEPASKVEPAFPPLKDASEPSGIGLTGRAGSADPTSPDPGDEIRISIPCLSRAGEVDVCHLHLHDEAIPRGIRVLGSCSCEARGVSLEVEGEDYWDALRNIRAWLEDAGWVLCCIGSRRDVLQSGMQRQFFGGASAYRVELGRPARRSDIVDIFDPIDPAGVEFSDMTIAAQDAFRDAWYREGHEEGRRARFARRRNRVLLGAALLLFILCGVRVRRAWIELDARDCQWNLWRIDAAKEQFALESNIRPKMFPTIDDLAPSNGTGYIKSFPACPSGHSYTIGAIGQAPVCGGGLPGHDLSAVPSQISDWTSGVLRDGRPVPSLLHRLLMLFRS